MTVQLHTISKEEFERYFDKWKAHWNKCIECQEDYLEENVSLLISVLVNTVLVLIIVKTQLVCLEKSTLKLLMSCVTIMMKFFITS